MDKLSKLHAMITAGLCATCVYLMVELGSATERAQAEAKRASVLQAELAQAVGARERLAKDVLALRTASATPYRGPATGITPSANGNATGPAGGRSPGAVFPTWRPPELSAEQRSLMARQRYGVLFRELALSEAQIEALLPVLAAQDQTALRTPNGRIAEATPTDPARNRAELAAILGPQKAAQFENLKKSLPARSQLAITRMQLEQAGEPMSDAQRDKLFAIMSAREPLPPPPLPVEGESSEQHLEHFRSWQEERERRLREDAASVLTPEQKKRLEENASLQASMRMLPGGMAGAAGARAP